MRPTRQQFEIAAQRYVRDSYKFLDPFYGYEKYNDFLRSVDRGVIVREQDAEGVVGQHCYGDLAEFALRQLAAYQKIDIENSLNRS